MALMLSLKGRVYLSFWVFGLINNVLYVVILSAAIDLVGTETPKAVVLLADVIPGFACKLLAPFFIHHIPYSGRLLCMTLLSFFGMQLVAFSNWPLMGIMLASLSGGLGEASFLSLTHYYEQWGLAGWSSGTGAAGLAGSFIFMVFTTWIKLSVKLTIVIFSVAPFSFLLIYSFLLPAPELRYQSIVDDDDNDEETSVASSVSGDERSLPTYAQNTGVDRDSGTRKMVSDDLASSIAATLSKLKPLVKPFMVPLFLVYVSEYIINQGISPTLLFPIQKMPFERYRDAYVTYGTLYQLGVFISRSSSPWFRIKRIYVPSLLQFGNLIFCILQSMYVVLPNVYIVMILIFYEGLLGGLAYVNTFSQVGEAVPQKHREFALGAVAMSDSAGVVAAGLISLWLEPHLCEFQIADGRNYCRMD